MAQTAIFDFVPEFRRLPIMIAQSQKIIPVIYEQCMQIKSNMASEIAAELQEYKENLEEGIKLLGQVVKAAEDKVAEFMRTFPEKEGEINAIIHAGLAEVEANIETLRKNALFLDLAAKSL